jgi:hypothetical protein
MSKVGFFKPEDFFSLDFDPNTVEINAARLANEKLCKAVQKISWHDGTRMVVVIPDPCTHPNEKIKVSHGWHSDNSLACLLYECECGTMVKPSGFEE